MYVLYISNIKIRAAVVYYVYTITKNGTFKVIACVYIGKMKLGHRKLKSPSTLRTMELKIMYFNKA